MGLRHGGGHPRIGGEGGLDGGVDVVGQHDGAAHIHRQQLPDLPRRPDGEEALEPQNLPGIGRDLALHRTEHGVGVLLAQGQGQHLRQQELGQLLLAVAPGHKDAADDQGTAPTVAADHAGEGGAAQAGVELVGVQAAEGGEAQGCVRISPAEQHQVVSGPPQLPAQGARLRMALQHCGAQLLLHRRLQLQAADEYKILRAEHRLVLGLPEVQAAQVDELLGHRVHHVGDVPPLVDGLPDAGGADLLQVGGQGQLRYMAGDAAVVRLRSPLGVAAEENVVKGVDGVLPGVLAVGGGPGHHIAARHDGHLPAGEGPAQIGKVGGVGDVHREILGKDVDVELVGHGQAGDAAADPVGLGLFRPGELVNGQHHLVAQVPDGPDDALVGEGEGVEGAGEEGHRPGLVKAEAPVEDLLLGDEAVQPPQHVGPVVEGQLVPRLLAGERQDLLQCQQEGPALLMAAQGGGGEHPPPQNEHGLLAHLLPEARQALEQHPQQPLPAAAVDGVVLREAGAVGVVGLVHDPHRVQHRRDHAAVGGAQVLPQVLQDLLQLRRRQPQAEPAQISGDILGELLLSDLQAPAELHRHLVALLGGEEGGDGQQSGSRPVADRHLVADLDEVGEVGGQVEPVGPLPPGEVPQQPDVHHLHDPGGGGLQVVQENFRHRVLIQGQGRFLLPGGHVPDRDVPQQRQGAAVAAAQAAQGVEDHIVGGEAPAQPVQQQRRRNPHLQILPLREGHGEVQQLIAVTPLTQLQGHGGGGLQQAEGRGGVQPLRPPVVAQELRQEQLPALRFALVQQGVDHKFQGKADPPPVLAHELPVGEDDPLQVQPPLVQVCDSPAVRHVVGGLLLDVPRVEAGNDPPHEGGGLAADVALTVHQQLVEEGQGLDLLGDAEIDGVGLEHAQIGPQPLPVRPASGLLQQAGEAPLAGEPAHQGDVVFRSQKLQPRHRLLRVQQRHILPLGGGRAAVQQLHIHPTVHHVAFKVTQLGVDEGVPPALFLVDIVQLGQYHVEGLRQSGDPGDLPAVRSPVLLDPEVGVDQSQGLRRQVVQLQVPHGVVGSHIADVLDVPPGEPLVGVVVVEIGHPLPGAAAELADVVARRAAGDQGQVHGHSGPLQIPGHADGHVVDPGDVLQGAEGGGLQPQAHHLIDVLPAEAAQEGAVAVPVRAVGELLLRQRLQLPQGVRRQQLPLRVQQHLEQNQEKHRPRPVAPPPGLKVLLREHGLSGEVVGKGQPPLLRGGGEARKILPAQGQHVGAGQAAAVIEGDEALDIVLPLHQLRHHLPVLPQIAGVLLACQLPQKAGVHLPHTLFVHGRSPHSGGRRLPPPIQFYSIMHHLFPGRKAQNHAGIGGGAAGAYPPGN